MELNEMEKRILYQTEGSERYAILHELTMASRYAQNPDRRKAAETGGDQDRGSCEGYIGRASVL